MSGGHHVGLVSGCVSACRAWGTVGARMSVVGKAVLGVLLGVGWLALLLLVGGSNWMSGGGVGGMLLRLGLGMMLLMNNARGSRMLLVLLQMLLLLLCRCVTLGLMVGVMLHREKTH